MTPRRRRVSFFLDPELEAGLKELKARVGIPEAEAMRRAIAEYLTRNAIGTDSPLHQRRRLVARIRDRRSTRTTKKAK